jgi:hypothetical protein
LTCTFTLWSIGSPLEKPSIFYRSSHFNQRLAQRGFDPDIAVLIVQNPESVRRCGKGEHGGNKYAFAGKFRGA